MQVVTFQLRAIVLVEEGHEQMQANGPAKQKYSPSKIR